MSTASIASTFETGSSGIYHLKRFWSKTMARKKGELPSDAFVEEWATDTALLDTLGLGIEQCFIYLYNHSQSFEAFEAWALELNNGSIPAEKLKRFHGYLLQQQQEPGSSGLSENVLSESDLAFWEENGYVIVHDAITPQQCQATEALIWQYLGYDKNNPATWYHEHKDRQGIMLQLFQHPVFEANRQSPRIRKAYEQLWGHTDLWVNTDRVGFNPPETDSWKFPGPNMHWDVSLVLPIPFGLQGILYITDTEAEQGAFTLVPGFQHRIEDWIHGLPPGTDPRFEDLHALGSVPLAGKAGDFIIWHHALPHGSRPNRTNKPRLVQYINWQPVTREIKHEWK